MSFNIVLKTLIEKGIHLGHHKSVGSSDMAPYLLGHRNKYHIIDLNTTIVALRRACKFIYELSARGGTVLFISMRDTDAAQIIKYANITKQPYIVKQWVPGLFTNWDHFSNIKPHFEEDQEHKLSKRTRNIFKGLVQLKNIPDAIILFGVNGSRTILKEAASKGIPVIAIADTNNRLASIDFPIPGNDDSVESKEFYLELFSSTIRKGLLREELNI